ncbi:MAG: FHA domain-containing protein [Nitrospirae bacterium]|nr:FHA domain-containing protein [Nitrospirota bacterium]
MVNEGSKKKQDIVVCCDCGEFSDDVNGNIADGWFYDSVNLTFYCPECVLDLPTYMNINLNEESETTNERDIQTSHYVILKTIDGAQIKVNNGNILGRKYILPYITNNLKDISRIHARFVFENDTWFVEDLKSSNGTFVNNDKIPPNKMLVIKKDDKIRFGKKLEFSIEDIM